MVRLVLPYFFETAGTSLYQLVRRPLTSPRRTLSLFSSIISATTYWDTNSHEKWFAMDKVPEFMKESLSSYTEE